MALARIITRSNPCSRQLALDLLGRGYAVEIVSPDSIPDNLADLELRVEEDPGNQLVASVEAHNGERSVSLEFLHYLKAPMPNFIRRPPESNEAVRLPKQPVSINAEEVELPAEAPERASETASPAAEGLPDSKLDPEPEPAEGTRLILPPDQSPSLPVERPGYVAVAPTFAQPLARPTVLPTTVRPRREPPRHDRSAGWLWRTALALASVVLLALVLASGMRRTSWSAGAGPAEKIAASSTDVSLLSVPVAERVPEKGPGRSLAVVPPAIKSEQNSDHMRKESQVAKAEAVTAAAATAGRGAIVPRRHGDGLIARDTVTYFHQRTFAEAASRAGTPQRFPIRHRRSRKHDDVIAANTVALEDKPVPKAAKPNSGIKRYSDLK
jgi:hypothetical protein